MSEHPMVGKYVVCRTYSAGVHAGILVGQDGDKVHLRESRRLWFWKARKGIALSGVAAHGLVASESKVDVPVTVYLTGAIETIETTSAAEESIRGA